MIRIKKINKEVVTPVIQKAPASAKTVRNYDQFPLVYNNVCIIARKNSGKSTLIHDSLKKSVDKNTHVIIFSPTFSQDPIYHDHIANMLDSKGVTYEVHPNIFDEEGNNIVEQFCIETEIEMKAEKDAEKARKENKRKKMEKIQNKEDFFKQKLLNQEGGDEEPPPKKKKLMAPRYILIFDDLSSAMRDKQVSKLLTKNKHFKSRIYMCLHNVSNLHPDGMRMVDTMILFPSINEMNLDSIAEKMFITHKDDTRHETLFKELYKDATSEPYNFLYFDKASGNFRKNFDSAYEIDQ